MADNYLERHREEYEERKKKWMARKKHITSSKPRQIEKPDDEAL